MIYGQILDSLKEEGNLRVLPEDYSQEKYIDFTSNDYLGIGVNAVLRREFIESFANDSLPSFSSSASRLLAGMQNSHRKLESLLEECYNRHVLLFNSGYHANTGIIPAIASATKTLIVADKLVHASIIDGIILSRADFMRFRHNDIKSLEQILAKHSKDYNQILVITESIFSMDGDKAPVEEIAELKDRYNNVVLYIDEAHAFGVCGEQGLGLTTASTSVNKWDIIVGTFGKAAASMGAFAAVSSEIRDYLINKSRSLIFSTALPPIQSEWTAFIVKKILTMQSERKHLEHLSKRMADILRETAPETAVRSSHIVPLIAGSASKAMEMSRFLESRSIKAMPIRRPTVAAGTERLRFSLSAGMTDTDLEMLRRALHDYHATAIS